MKIAVIGSTSATGKLILQEATRRGHEVAAFARHADALASVSGLANVVEGDGRDRAALERAVASQDAVIDAVGSSGTPDAISAVARNLTEAMRAAGVPRLVATSAYGMVAKRPRLLASIVRRIFRATFGAQISWDAHRVLAPTRAGDAARLVVEDPERVGPAGSPSCCHANGAPGPSVKLLSLAPRRQTTLPVCRLTS